MTTSETKKDVVVEWILWKHLCGRTTDSGNQWKTSTSEVAHFFAHPNNVGAESEPFIKTNCDLSHLPVPSKSFFLKNQPGKHNLAPSKHTEYSLFKQGIEPNWEDKHCEGELYTKHYFPSELLDQYWQELVQGVMDEKIETKHICGVRVVDKSHGVHPLYKLELWLDTKDTKIRHSIEKQVMECLTVDEHHRFKLHWRDFPDQKDAVEKDTAAVKGKTVSDTTAPAKVATKQ